MHEQAAGAPSRAKLMPSAGSGTSGGTSSTGRSTDQLPSEWPAGGRAARRWNQAFELERGAGPGAEQAAVKKGRGGRAAQRRRTIEAEVVALGVARVVELARVCGRVGGASESEQRGAGAAGGRRALPASRRPQLSALRAPRRPPRIPALVQGRERAEEAPSVLQQLSVALDGPLAARRPCNLTIDERQQQPLPPVLVVVVNGLRAQKLGSVRASRARLAACRAPWGAPHLDCLWRRHCASSFPAKSPRRCARESSAPPSLPMLQALNARTAGARAGCGRRPGACTAALSCCAPCGESRPRNNLSHTPATSHPSKSPFGNQHLLTAWPSLVPRLEL